MKKNISVLLTVISLLSIGQNNAQVVKTKRYTHGLHDYYFYSNGTYIETVDAMILEFPNQYCSQSVIDSGKYFEKGGCCILNSSEKIDSMRIFDVISNYESEDSLIIVISSPYEQVIKRNKNFAIYTYNIQILCDSSLSGEKFERDFNENHQFCISGEIRIQKPKEVSVKNITVVIYPNHKFDKYFTSFSPNPFLTIEYQPRNNDNHFCINLPYFEYLALTYRNRRAYQIKKNNKRILCNGIVYRRYRPHF